GYTITVTAINGCPEIVTQPITQPDELKIENTPAVSPFECTDGNKTNYATITVTGVVGGTGEYRYELVNTDTEVTVQDGPDALYTETNLAGGTYTITVYDEKGCSTITTAEIIPFVGISDPYID